MIPPSAPFDTEIHRFDAVHPVESIVENLLNETLHVTHIIINTFCTRGVESAFHIHCGYDDNRMDFAPKHHSHTPALSAMLLMK